MEPRSWQRNWRFMIDQILEQRKPSSWRDRTSRERLLRPGNAGISITRRGAKSDVDSDCSDKIRDRV